MRRCLVVAAAVSGLGLALGLPMSGMAQDAGKPEIPTTPATTPVATPDKPAEPAASPVAAPVREANAPVETPAAVKAPDATPPAPAPGKPEAPPEKIEKPVQAVAPPPPAEFTLDIASAVAKLQTKGAVEKREAEAIAAFYAARNGRPLWHDQAGRKPEAVALITEIGQAGDYGLDPTALDVATLAPGVTTGATPETRAEDELRITQTVLKYARHARGGRIEPTSLTKFLDRKINLFEPASILDQIASAKDPAAYLRQLHPQHPEFERLRQVYLTLRRSSELAVATAKIPDGPQIKPGATHPHVALVRARLALAAPKSQTSPPADANLFDDTLVAAIKEFQVARGLKPADGTIGNGTRAALNNIVQGSPRKVLANMEQWRWMPDELGEFYVWVNVPEFTLRVVRDGKVIHTERIVAGKTDTQTPIFSDSMEQVIFHPFWGVPDGIKSNEIQPALAKGAYGVLAKHNLRIQSGGRDIDPSTVDWRTADLRRFHVYQPPGSDNVLGVVKFRFPNKHDVYMHDTPTKGLFSTPVRAYSHGCMRVQNPVRLAEIVLAEDKRMAAERVRSLAAPGAPANNQINLTKPIPVHITYFTATVDEGGQARYFSDIYGHENRINLALEGKAHLIARVSEPKGPVRAEPVARLSETLPQNRDWMRNVFSNN